MKPVRVSYFHSAPISRRPSKSRSTQAGCAFAIATAASLIFCHSVQAAVQTYDPANLLNVWDLTAVNWDSSTAAWTNGNSAIFGGTGESVAVNAAITVGNITFNSSGYTIADGSGGLTLASPSNTFTVTNLADSATISETIAGVGNSITIAGAGTLSMLGNNTYTGGTTISSGTVRVNSANSLGTGGILLNGGTFATTAGFATNRVMTVGASGGTINVSSLGQYHLNTAGDLTGSGPLTIVGSSGTLAGQLPNAGNFRISAANTGYTGAITLQNGGMFEYGVTNSVGVGASFIVNAEGELDISTVTANHALTINGGILGFQNGTTGNFAGAVSMGALGMTVALRDWYAVNTARSGTISNVISGTSGISVNSGLSAGGTLTLTAANLYSGATNLVASNLTLNGAAGSIKNSTSITLDGAGRQLLIDYTGVALGSVDRIGDTSGVTLTRGNELKMQGAAAAVSSSESIGTISFGLGNNTVSVSVPATGVSTLTSAAFDRGSSFATGLIRGSNLGTGASSTGRVIFTSQTGLNLIGAATTAVNLKIVPFLIGDTSGTGIGRNFVTYGANGIRPLDTAEQSLATAGATDDNVKTVAGANNIVGAKTFNSFLVGAGATAASPATTATTVTGNGAALTLTSGALAHVATTATGTGNVTGFSSIIFGSAGANEAIITNANSAGSLTIDSPIDTFAANGALTKSGAGTVILSQNNLYTGATTINQGTLQLGTGGALGSISTAGTIINNGILAFNRSVSMTQGTDFGAATIVGTGGYTQMGSGTTTINASSATGAVTITAGTLNLTSTIPDNTLSGAVTVSGGVLNLTGNFGYSVAANQFRVGTVTNVKAVLNILSGSTLTNRSNLFVGDGGTGTGGGAVFQSGGTLTLTQAAGVDNLRIGSNGTGYGYYNLSGGTITSNRPAIGASLADTVGVVDVTGGTFAANEQLHIAAGSATSSGLLNVTGGAVTAGTDIRLLQVQAGTAGATSQGVLNVGGGGGLASVTTGNNSGVGLNLAQTNNVAGAMGVANILTNGTLNTGRILGSQANATTHLNFNGGTLKATATNSGTTFLTDANIDAVNVYSAGGTINNNNTAITISKGLLAPTGSGVSGSSIAVASGGTGYVGVPLVKLTGGTGSGATGYAVVTGGVVTSIVVTSPGIGYTPGDTLTATFFGGAYATAATNVTGIAVASNTSGGMTFAGGSAGATTLSGTSTYTGATSVASGKLFVNGSLAAGSAVAVSSGATLGGLGTVNGATTVASGGIIEAGQAATGKLTLGGGLTFSGTGNVNFGTLSNYAASTGVNAGAMTLNGAAGSVVINIASIGTATAGNTYTLFDYSGGSIGGTGYSALTLAALPSRGIGNLVDTGSQINLSLTSLDYLKWTGSAGTAWNTSNSSWKLNSNNNTTSYINTPGDSVVFDDSTANGVVDVSGADVNPTSVVFNNATTNYTLQGSNAVAGLTSVVKNSGASLTITNSNTYSGGTALNAGTLNLNNASAIGTGALTITGGTIDNTAAAAITLSTNNVQAWNGDFAFGGTKALNLGTGAVTLGANRIVTVNGTTEALTAGGIISGSGFSLTKNGTGTLILGGVNTYNGGTTVNAGTLQINQSTGAAATGTFNLAGGNFTVNASANNFGYAATLNLSADTTFSKIGASQINYTGTLTGTGNVLNVNTSAGRLYMNGAVSGVTQINVTSGAMGFDLNVGNRGGSAPVNVSNGASLWLANSTNAVTNNITLNGGTGQGATGALFQEGAGTPTISGSVTLSSGDSSIGGNTAVATANVTISGQITGAGALTKIGINKYTFSGANNYTGSTTINAGTLAAGVASVANVSGAFGNNSAVTLGNVAGAILDITGFNTQIGSITGGGATGGNVTLGAATLTTGGDNTSPAAYAGVISGTGGFTKIGSGNQILSGTNTYTGTTDVQNGTVQLTGSLSAATTLNLGNGSNSGKFILGGATAAVNQTVAGLTTTGSGTTNAVVGGFTANSTLTVNTTAGTNTFGGTLGGAGTNENFLTLVKTGAGTLEITSANNTFGGGTNIGVGQDAAVVRASATQALGTGTIAFDGAGNASAARLELTGGSSLNNAIALAGRNSASVAIQNISGSNALSGTITLGIGGSNYWIQSGAGLLTLSGATAITAASGSRTVTLQGAGDGLISGIVQNGGGTVGITKSDSGTWTLSGTNTYTGATTINAGGTLSLGSTGSITASSIITANGTLDVSAQTGITIGAAQTLKGSGTVNVGSGGNLAIAGTLAAGNSPGVLTVSDGGAGTGSTSFSSGSIFSWDLDTTLSGRGTAFDGVNTSAVTGTDAVFQVVLQGTESFDDAFWTTTHTWSDIFTTNGSTPVSSDLAAVFSSFTYANGSGVLSTPSASIGSFTLTGSTLSWSAVPEPTSALAGLLLGAGLLRRRRNPAGC